MLALKISRYVSVRYAAVVLTVVIFAVANSQCPVLMLSWRRFFDSATILTGIPLLKRGRFLLLQVLNSRSVADAISRTVSSDESASSEGMSSSENEDSGCNNVNFIV